MSLISFYNVYPCLGLVAFFSCVLYSSYCWLKLAYYLPKLRKELGKYTDRFKIKPLDFFSLEGNSWCTRTKSQNKNNEILFGTEFSSDPQVAFFKQKCAGYYKNGIYSCILGVIIFVIFFGWDIYTRFTHSLVIKK